MTEIWLTPQACALEGYKVRCLGQLQKHHVLGKGWARGLARAVIEPPELMADVCANHNVGKWADQHDARRILVLQAIYMHGFSRIAELIDKLPWKVPLHELTLPAILEPDAD